MAGIAGFVNTKADEKVLQAMGDSIKHRGPDYELRYADSDIKLIYRGLSIGHKSEGKELYSDDKTVVCITGYIENEDELKEYLSRNGVKVNKDMSAAEAVAGLYGKFGTDYDFLIEGSFLITIWDKALKKLIIIKDQFGVQPVFYYETENGIIFASELKALLLHPEFKKEFNGDALKTYLVFQVPVLRESFMKGAFKLPPATVFSYCDGKTDMHTYWDLKFSEKNNSLEENAKLIDEKLKTSVERRTRLSKPIGSFLSGGVDSSYLVSIYKPNNTFTVGYNSEEFSEIGLADGLSEILGIKNISEILTGNECMDKLGEIQYMMDEPSSNPSAVPMYFLSKLAKDNGYSAVLSGEGSDEIFGGYFEYTVREETLKYRKLPKALRKKLADIALKLPVGTKGRNFILQGSPDISDYYIGQAKVFGEVEAEKLLKDTYRNAPGFKDITRPYLEKIRNEDELIQKQYLDFHVWMPNDINLKADRMTMANSVQTVTPILDNSLLELAETLPEDQKVHGSDVKIAFRKAALKNLPEEWAKRKKKGFPVPIRYWVKEDRYYREIRKAFTSETAKKFFDTKKLLLLLDEHKLGIKKNQRKIWTVYMFILWYNEYFVKR